MAIQISMIPVGNLVIGLFFLYCVSFSGLIQNMFSCRLQKIFTDSIVFRHVLVFLTIYIFTYILGWYTDTAILTGKTNFENENNLQINQDITDGFTTTQIQKQKQKQTQSQQIPSNMKGYKALLTYAVYSLGIYILFLMTTKCEFEFLGGFLAILLGTFIIHILRLYGDLGDVFKTIENGMMGVGFVILLGGSLMYLQRQLVEHRQDWSTLMYIFGNPKCRG